MKERRFTFLSLSGQPEASSSELEIQEEIRELLNSIDELKAVVNGYVAAGAGHFTQKQLEGAKKDAEEILEIESQVAADTSNLDELKNRLQALKESYSKENIAKDRVFARNVRETIESSEEAKEKLKDQELIDRFAAIDSKLGNTFEEAIDSNPVYKAFSKEAEELKQLAGQVDTDDDKKFKEKLTKFRKAGGDVVKVLGDFFEQSKQGLEKLEQFSGIDCGDGKFCKETKEAIIKDAIDAMDDKDGSSFISGFSVYNWEDTFVKSRVADSLDLKAKDYEEATKKVSAALKHYHAGKYNTEKADKKKNYKDRILDKIFELKEQGQLDIALVGNTNAGSYNLETRAGKSEKWHQEKVNQFKTLLAFKEKGSVMPPNKPTDQEVKYIRNYIAAFDGASEDKGKAAYEFIKSNPNIEEQFTVGGGIFDQALAVKMLQKIRKLRNTN